MANNSGSNAKTSCNPNPNSSGEQFECSSSFSQLAISQTGSELKVEAGPSLTTGSALQTGQQAGTERGTERGASVEQQSYQKSPHVPNQSYWAYSQLPTPTSNQAASSTNQPAAAAASFSNTASSTGGTVFSRAQDNVRENFLALLMCRKFVIPPTTTNHLSPQTGQSTSKRTICQLRANRLDRSGWYHYPPAQLSRHVQYWHWPVRSVWTRPLVQQENVPSAHLLQSLQRSTLGPDRTRLHL